jgi:hypothetical protein
MKMIDHMAQAMCEAQTWVGAWGKAPEAERNAWLWLALAALKAMREPTEEMYCNGDEAILGCLNNHSGLLDPVTPAQKCWGAAIDAAIKEAEAE